jgi:hypothetical protein
VAEKSKTRTVLCEIWQANQKLSGEWFLLKATEQEQKNDDQICPARKT